MLDGVIAAAAALVAAAHAPTVAGYLIVGHLSSEPAAAAALRHLELSPLLDLGLRAKGPARHSPYHLYKAPRGSWRRWQRSGRPACRP